MNIGGFTKAILWWVTIKEEVIKEWINANLMTKVLSRWLQSEKGKKKKTISMLQDNCQKLLSFTTELQDGIRVIGVHMHRIESHTTIRNTNE